jgi:hypothetical protein
MTEQAINTIPPRWISISQLMQYAPAMGRKKIKGHIDQGDFYAYLDGGEWIIDRLTVDAFFQRKQQEREAAVATALAKVSGL